MTDWICPNCRGGFPQVVIATDDECPWCGQELGEYEPPTVHSISRVKSDEPKGGPIYQRLFGWLE